MTLRSRGDTTYFSANLPSYLPGGPNNQVDWLTTSLAGVDLSNYLLTLPAATISVLVLTADPGYRRLRPERHRQRGRLRALAQDDESDGANLPADGNHNNVIDTVDYTYWRNHFGTIASGAGGISQTAIPEPASATLLGVALIGFVFVRRHRAR